MWIRLQCPSWCLRQSSLSDWRCLTEADVILSALFDDFPVLDASSTNQVCESAVTAVMRLLGFKCSEDKEVGFNERIETLGLVFDTRDVSKGEKPKWKARRENSKTFAHSSGYFASWAVERIHRAKHPMEDAHVIHRTTSTTRTGCQWKVSRCPPCMQEEKP